MTDIPPPPPFEGPPPPGSNQPYGNNQPYGSNQPYGGPPPYPPPPQYGTPQPYGGPPPYGPYPGGPQQSRPGSGMAAASLVLGIVGILSCFFGLVLGALAVIFGILAGRKGGYGGVAISGIITGSIGFLIGAVFAVAMVAGIIAEESAEPVRADVVEELIDTSDVAEAAPSTSAWALTEESVAASGAGTAYAAYLAETSPQGVLDGMFDGAAVDTPCFSFDGAPWWVEQGDPDICMPHHELWWEVSSSTPYTVTDFGVGAPGSAIVVESVSAATLAGYGATDLDTLTQAIATEFFPAQGVSVAGISETALGGERATVIDVEVDGFEHYSYYVVHAPRAYDAAGGAEYFGIRLFNELEWVYEWDDVVSRFEETFAWK